MNDRSSDTSDSVQTAAFFDLDRTLIEMNSALDYARFEYRRGGISLFQLARTAIWMGLYHLSMVDMERAFAEAVRHYRGAHVDELRAITAEFFHQHVVDSIQPGAESALEFHRHRDHPLVLLTASSPYMSELAAETLDLDDWLCNRFPTDEQGRLRGTFERPMCYGEGKVHRARCWAKNRDVELGESYFYTDSYSDVPMLEQVKYPRVVNPDPRLRRAAEQRGWPIEDWSTPQPAEVPGRTERDQPST